MPGVRWPVLVLALVAVLGGCSTIGLAPGSPTPAATATPALPDPLPPGVTVANVSAPLDLARAHTAALTGQSFTYRTTVVVRTSDGIRLGTVRTVRRVGDDGTFVHRMRVEGVVPSAVADVRAVDAYSNGTRVLIRFRREGRNRTLDTAAAESPIAANDVVQKGFVYSVVASTRPTVRGSIERGGTTYVHVKGDNGTTRFGFVEATNVTFEALIAPSGLVYRYAVSYHANSTDYAAWEGRIVRDVVYEDVGSTTVTRPAWTEGARANATAVPTGR